MLKAIVRRLLILIPQIIALSIVVFIIAHFMPGDALSGLYDQDMREEDIAYIRHSMGLDRPMTVQYLNWVLGLFRFDFGRSFHTHRPVLDVIGERAANTFRLSLLTTIFMYLIAIPLGMVAGRYKEKFVDKLIVFYTFFAIAVPTMLFAIINLWLFSFRLEWFPLLGSADPMHTTGTLAFHLSKLHHLILPAFTGALLFTVGTINILRNQIIENENADFVVTARSKGAPRRAIYNRHILKNASLPVVAGFGSAITGLLGGNIFIEKVFSFPGMGQLFVSSVITRDYPVVNTLVMIYGVLIVVGVLLSDVFMMILDPRIRVK